MTTVQIAIPWRDCGCEYRRAAWDWIREGWAIRHPGWQIVTGDNEGAFNIPAALNATLRKCTADVIVVSGADAQIHDVSLKVAVEQALVSPWVMASDSMIRLAADVSTKALGRLKPGQALPQGPGNRRLCQLGWGVLVGRREVFEAVTWDERLNVAWEDSAWGYAAALLVGEPHRVGRVSTRLLWHPPCKRHKQPGYQEASTLNLEYRTALYSKNQAAMRELLKAGR